MRISSLPTYLSTCLPPTYLPTSYLPTYLSSAYLRTLQFEAVAEQKRSADLRARHGQVLRISSLLGLYKLLFHLDAFVHESIILL